MHFIQSLTVLALAATLAANPAHAQSDWPAKPIRIIVPSAPGAAAELRDCLAEHQAGPGPALLFIPGAYHCAWRHAGGLRRGRTAGIACAALDYRGHGALAADGLAVDTLVEAYDEDAALAARTFAVPPVIVGHSLGGLVAMVTAM